MWIWSQSKGEMKHDDVLLGVGYAGMGLGKNNTLFQEIHNQGPLPQGSYTIQAPRDSGTLGPYVLDLEPAETNQMFGRSLFRIHGENASHVGYSSDGCIVLNHPDRVQIWESGDHALTVTA